MAEIIITLKLQIPDALAESYTEWFRSRPADIMALIDQGELGAAILKSTAVNGMPVNEAD